jgi:hypothetical protein
MCWVVGGYIGQTTAAVCCEVGAGMEEEIIM